VNAGLHVWILRAVIRFGTKVVIHDSASSHAGAAPERFLRTLGVELVIKVPRNATWALAPADHTNMNGDWSLVASQVVADMELKAKLEGHFKKKAFSSLTKDARELVSEVLAEIGKRMSSPEHKEAIRRGWQQTFLGTEEEKHKDLRTLLNLGKQLPARVVQPQPRYECPVRCGERFTNVLNTGTKKFREHKKACWNCRNDLLAPLPDPCEVALNQELPVGLTATILHGGKQKLVEFVVTPEDKYRYGKYETREIETKVVLKDKWWKRAVILRYSNPE
jgi:hypothetical protein